LDAPARLAVIFILTAVVRLSMLCQVLYHPPLLWKLHVSPRAAFAVSLAAFSSAAPIFKVPKSVFQVRKIDHFSELAKGYLILKSHL
jgi:hypothetical protein